MQERIKLAPSQAHTYNNPAVNYLFVQATVTAFLVAEASAGVALAMSWQIQNRGTKKISPLSSESKCRQHKLLNTLSLIKRVSVKLQLNLGGEIQYALVIRSHFLFRGMNCVFQSCILHALKRKGT